MSPSNFPATNPEVIRKAIETRSVSLTDGMQNLIDDLQKGWITRVDESAFEVGRNLAIHSEVSEVVIVEHQGREINAFYRELGWNGIFERS